MQAELQISSLDPQSFQQLVNMLILRVLGAGATGFGPGPDGGRDGYFQGSAPYPSATQSWNGVWYIQSKFHKPHLSKNPQKWLLAEVKKEIEAFQKYEGSRTWPDNWIIATNIDPSGKSKTGSFDTAKALVKQANPQLSPRFDIWGGRKILDLLALHNDVADYYRHFLTPGHVLSAVLDAFSDQTATIKEIVHYLTVEQFDTHRFTKLDQAGSAADTRPGVHELFVDLPFETDPSRYDGFILEHLLLSAAKCHSISQIDVNSDWRRWQRHPSRARVLFVLGGPGNGKSTTTQYFSQLQRAALIAAWPDTLHPKFLDRANEIHTVAAPLGHWPLSPRIPVSVELRDYAYWFGKRKDSEPRGVLTYLASRISSAIESPVSAKLLKRAISTQRWFIGFDGLDEVPNDVKEPLAEEIIRFIDKVAIECASDTLFLCTSRPQGYSGQFDELEAVTCRLSELNIEQALRCAQPVVSIGRTKDEAEKGMRILKSAATSPSVRSLMTTPLQAHIMAVVVRDGKRPPERRWQLFENFYQVIKRREANRDLPDARLARLLREEDQLLKTVHNRLGFVLHARAETSEGAQTSLLRHEFLIILRKVVQDMKDGQIDETVQVLNEATATRLVLVNTPDDGNSLRFDIRPLQEFFAAEFLHDTVDIERLQERVAVLLADAHWREVMHHLFSALIEARRMTEITQIVRLLEQTDEEGGTPQLRELNRRLSIGALMAARLAQDGVLEQDKRIRRLFSNAMKPLLGSTDPSKVVFLGSIRHLETRAWLLDLCIDQIRNADSSESVGASMLLWWLLRDTDPLVSEYVEVLEAKPLLYQAAVANTLPNQWAYTRDGARAVVQVWQAEYLYRLLSRTDWYLLAPEMVRRIVHSLAAVVGRRTGRSVRLARGREGIHRALLQLFDSGGYGRQSFVDRESQKVDIGMLSICRMANGWHTRKTHVRSLNSLRLPRRSSATYGIFDVLEEVVRYCRTPGMQSYNMLIEKLKPIAMKGDAGEMFRPIEHYLPFANDSLHGLDKLRSVRSDASLSKRLALVEEPTFMYINDDREITLADWKRTVADYPDVAAHLLFLNVGYRADETGNRLREASYVAPFVDMVLRRPCILHPGTILGWGLLIDRCPDKEAEIRSAWSERLKEANADDVLERDFVSDLIAPFGFDLEADVYLVPYVINAAVLRFHDSGRGEPSRRGSNSSRRSETEELLKKYVPTVRPDFVRRVLEKEASLSSAYVVLLLLMYPDSGLDRRIAYNYLVETYSRRKSSRLLYLVLSYLGLYFPAPDNLSRDLLANLLYDAHSDLRHRSRFHSILRQWRESSCASAQHAGAIDTWL
jgi:hypothetical protein